MRKRGESRRCVNKKPVYEENEKKFFISMFLEVSIVRITDKRRERTMKEKVKHTPNEIN